MTEQDNIYTASSLSESCSSRIQNPGPGVIRIKAGAFSDGGTEYTASNEGVEVEAIEFDSSKSDDERLGFHCQRRLLLLVLAFWFIVTASAVSGFLVLRAKNKTSLASAVSSADYTEVVDALDVTNNNDNAGVPILVDADKDAVVDLKDAINLDATNPSESPTSASTFTPSSSTSETATVAASSEVSTTASWGSTTLWADPVCPDHNIVVSSSCVAGSANALSTASFCFASKRDGDWYWVRNSATENGSTAVYDSWDYTDEKKGELTILDLSKGNYIMSLVRDSMQPYDEIVSHEFTVPECE